MSQEQKELTSISELPKEKLPKSWSNETELNVLYSPCRSRTVNPKDWEVKIAFWKKSISTYCDYSKVYTFKLCDIEKAFNRDGRAPSCLSTVVEEMLKSGELKTLEQFLEKTPETWTGWATNLFIKKPVLWSFNKVKSSLIYTSTDHIYVHVATVHKHASNLLKDILEAHKHKTIDYSELKDTCKINDENLQLLIHRLECQNKVSIRELKSNNEMIMNTILVKFGDIKSVGEITDLEVNVYILEESEKMLTKNIQKLEIEISSVVAEAKSYIVKGHKQTAKSCLRKKREVEKRVAKAADALFNVQTLLSRIQEANLNAQVLGVYKDALTSLKHTFKEKGLTEDNVANVMLEIGEVLDIHDDIQNTLAQPINDTDVDLEQELAELVNPSTAGGGDSSGPKEKQSQKIEDLTSDMIKLSMNLPNVPATNLNRSKIDLAL